MQQQPLWCLLTSFTAQMNTTPLSEARVIDLLQTLERKPLTYKYLRVNRPGHGATFGLVVHPSQTEVPDDGYIYQDAEVARRFTTAAPSNPNVPSTNTNTGRELEMFARDQGFALGDTMIGVHRRRYRFVGSQFQIVHYIVLDPAARKVPIKMTPQLAHWMQLIQQRKLQQQQQQQQQQQHSSSHTTSTTTPATSALAHRRPPQQPQSVPVQPQQQPQAITTGHQYGMDDTANNAPGDDLDHLNIRDIAAIRFKRNHLFMEYIFSPSNMDELVQEAKPIFPVPNAQQYKQDHQAKLDALTKELDTLQHQHTARITQLKDDDKFYHQLMTSLNTCTNDTELKVWQDKVCDRFGLKMVPAARAMKVQLASTTAAPVPSGTHHAAPMNLV